MADNIQISDLKFDEIKNSLVNYLRTTTTFKDYDFEGSGIRTLIDLLAYNTFYYAFYSNMIANEMFLNSAKLESSLVSLTKPLGYVLINSTSAYSNVKLDNLNAGFDNISAFSKFSSFDANGTLYYFYNIKDVKIERVVNGETINYETNYFPIYEGKYLVYRQQVSVDLVKQQFFLSGLEIDPRTIVLETLNDGSTYDRWENYLVNTDVVIGPTSKVFFIERKNNGYEVLFGKQSETEESFSSIGRQIQEGETVLVSYLVSSGENANGIFSFNLSSDASGNNVKNENTQTITLFASKSGRSTPNLENVRFFAPKTFARQNRLVTKGDYYAILNELGYGEGSDPDFDFKVFGGEEATPPYYGRIFVSILDLNPTDPEDYTETNQINEVMAVLKSKSVVGILPEYIPPVEVKVKLEINASIPGVPTSVLNERTNSLRNAIITRYSTKKYNNDIIEEEIKDLARSAATGIIIRDEGIYLYATLPVEMSLNQQKILNFKNQIATNNFSVVANLTNFDIKSFQGQLFKYDKSTQQSISDTPVGEVDYDTGIVTLYRNLGVNETFTVKISCRDDNFYAKDEFIAYIQDSDLTIRITNT